MAGDPNKILTGEAERLAEAGLPLPTPTTPGPPGSGVEPPGNSTWVVPHFQSFASVWNTVSRTYRWTFDEALTHSQQNARDYRKDPVVWEALRARQMPLAGSEWSIKPKNEMDPLDIEHSKRVQGAIEETPNLQQLLMSLLEAAWYGRAGSTLTYRWDWSEGYRRAIVDNHNPVNGDKLIFRYSGEVGILVGGDYPGSWIPTDRGRAHICTSQERQALIVHQFEREDADFYDARQAGRVEGVGLRDRLYWFQFLKQRVLAWMMEFLERVGAGGWTIYYYESGNPCSLAEVKEAAEKQSQNTSILFPRYSDGKAGPGIQRIEPSQSGAQLLLTLVTDYFDRIIRRVILGQSLSAEAGGTGMGSGVAELHADTLNKIITYDARNLQETLTKDFVSVISRHIDPARRPPRWIYDVDKPNASEYMGAATRFFEMGGDIDEDTTRSVLGLPRPKPGAPLLSKYGPLGSGPVLQQQMMQNAMMGMLGMGGPGMGMGPGGGQPMLAGNIVPGHPVAQPIPTATNNMATMLGGATMDPGVSPSQNLLLQALMGGGRI
jgi:hypothetical protein